MNLLTGEYSTTLDEKGRISLPAKIKAAIDCGSLVVTRGFDKCLWLFTPNEWEKISSSVMEKASPFNPQHRSVLRHLISPATDIEIDKSGRLSIGQTLRESAGLTKECVLLGVNKYLELWDAKTYEEYLEANASSIDGAAEELGAIVF